MNRIVLIGLFGLSAAMGGCVSSMATNERASVSDGMAAPATAPSAPLPANAFAPSPNHYFGTGGP